jgi:CubicO group peptidase (beta-lactamase class C family)
VKLKVDADGRIAGLRFGTLFLEGLPTRPISLEDLQERLKQAVEHTLHVYRVPSVSLALVKHDRIVWARAFGYQNVAKAVPADPETAYVTGSIFKVVVATALMQLVDEGKMDLDDPINGYLKGFQVPNPYAHEAPLTLRHLLSHHGGVPNGAATVSLWKRSLPTPLEELVRKQVKVTTRPGTKFQYSNVAFAFNGYLLGQVTEERFEDAIRRRLLEPLEMARTQFEPTGALCENLAIPYTNSTDGKSLSAIDRVRFDVYPAGDVYATPSDIAHFLILHLNGGKYRGRQLLSAKTVEEMGRPQFAKPGEGDGFGLGWAVTADGGKKRLEHNGAVPGFYTFMGIEPAAHTGVVLFCNKFSSLEVSFGTFVDPLLELSRLAFALLDKLEVPQAAVKP